MLQEERVDPAKETRSVRGLTLPYSDSRGRPRFCVPCRASYLVLAALVLQTLHPRPPREGGYDAARARARLLFRGLRSQHGLDGLSSSHLSDNAVKAEVQLPRIPLLRGWVN